MKKLISGIVTFIIIAAAFLLTAKYMIESSFPEYDGEIQCEGIEQNVDIYRESSGIPVIYASSETDAAFALGYVHAQERFFQMELMRRAVEGRLSEVIGEKTVDIDIVFRTLGLFEAAKASEEILSDETKIILNSYSNGINKYLEENKNKISIEFDLLDYSPEKWEPVHTIAIGKLLAWELNLSWWIDAALIDVAKLLSPEELKDILPYDISLARAKSISELLKQNKSLDRFLSVNKSAQKLLSFSSNSIGSNGWAIDSGLAVKGKPIIANDTHLALSLPDKWLFVVEHLNDYSIAGFTLPGVPSVIIGTNKKIAWGLTNLMADQCDYYVEKIDTSTESYFFNNKWRKLIVKTENIKIKNAQSIEIKIYKTIHGPIVTGRHIFNYLYKDLPLSNNEISIAWSALSQNDDIECFWKVNRADDWESFRNALVNFSSPAQNFIYADYKGNIGLQSVGKIPIRSLPGMFVYDGTKDNWKGFLPFEKMPAVFNPVSGFIANANNEPIKGSGNYISNLWEPSSRIRRITELLSISKKFDANDFKSFQRDLYSDYPKKFIRAINNAFSNTKLNDENLKLTLELLNQWDYKYSKYTQPAAIFEVFLHKLLKNLFADELGEPVLNEFSFISNVPFLSAAKLLDIKSSLWDNKATGDIIERKNNIIRQSLLEAIIYLENNLGKDPANWQWGRLHKITLKHPFNGINNLIDENFNIGEYEMDGSGTTLLNSGYSFNEPFNVELGSAMRMIYDFSDTEHLYLIQPSGISGHPQSEFYGNMTERWLEGKYIKVSLNETDVIDSQKLTLIPR